MTKVAIVGATGAVGRTMLSILEERDGLASNIRLMASHRSAGQTVSTKWGDIVLERLRVMKKENQEPWLALPQASYFKDGEKRYQNVLQLPLRLKRQIEAKAFEELGLARSE